MPSQPHPAGNREQRRNPQNAKSMGKWLHIEDVNGHPYDIYMKDISGRDEYDWSQAMPNSGGLCDIFLKGDVSLVTIAGLIWSQRRKFEKKLSPIEVLSTVNMMSIESMEMHDPDDPNEGEDVVPPEPVVTEPQGFSDGSDRSPPGSGPSTA